MGNYKLGEVISSKKRTAMGPQMHSFVFAQSHEAFFFLSFSRLLIQAYCKILRGRWQIWAVVLGSAGVSFGFCLGKGKIFEVAAFFLVTISGIWIPFFSLQFLLWAFCFHVFPSSSCGGS